jgi:hypothetical protein
VADPEGASHCAQCPAAIEVRPVSPLEAADVVIIAAEHVRRSREQLEILGDQRRRLLGRRQRFEGVEPRASGV